MALLTPLLLLVLMGGMELGRYFWHQHVVLKGVRDGARFAARQPMSSFVSESGSCLVAPGGSVTSLTSNLVRTGQLSGGTSPISYWKDNATVTVTISCTASIGGVALTGIYSGLGTVASPVGAPIVTVRASVPYQPLFLSIAESMGVLKIGGAQKAAVTGV
jgi:hypothetical protein